MGMTHQNSQATLHRAYQLLISDLDRAFPLRGSSDEVRALVWEPVAQSCIIWLLRQVLSRHECDDLVLPVEALRDIARSACRDDAFAHRIGLNRRRTRKALALGCAVLCSDLFAVPSVLIRQGDRFTIERTSEGLLVKSHF